MARRQPPERRSSLERLATQSAATTHQKPNTSSERAQPNTQHNAAGTRVADEALKVFLNT